MEQGQRPDLDVEREEPSIASEEGEAAPALTPDEAVLAARRAREESGREQESTSDFDKIRESGFGA